MAIGPAPDIGVKFWWLILLSVDKTSADLTLRAMPCAATPISFFAKRNPSSFAKPVRSSGSSLICEISLVTASISNFGLQRIIELGHLIVARV